MFFTLEFYILFATDLTPFFLNIRHQSPAFLIQAQSELLSCYFISCIWFTCLFHHTNFEVTN